MDDRTLFPNDVDWARIEQYVTGDGPPAELEALARWIQCDPERRRIADELRRIGTGSLAGAEIDDRAAWARVREQLHGTPVHPIRLHRTTPPRIDRINPRPLPWQGMAAAAVLIVAIAIGVSVRPDTRGSEKAVARKVPSREIVTRRGERATIDLSDGTHVILAPGSRLVIPPEFDVRSAVRELKLDGQAHFTVQHDSTRPFRVVTADLVAHDIGTAFVVSSYPENAGTRVVVTEGVVALLRPAESRALMVLNAGDLGAVDSTGQVTERSKVDVESYLDWTRGRLVFDSTRLSVAIPQLERWFDLTIRLADPRMETRRLTGAFVPGSSNQRISEVLSLALGLTVTQDGRTLLLSYRTSGDRQ